MADQHLQETKRQFAWQCPDCGLMDDPAEGYECRDGRHRFGEPVEVVPRSVADALAEALATIAVDISKYETDSEGLVWRVKLAHEAHLAFLAGYPPEEAER